jgi:hypothetical protein
MRFESLPIVGEGRLIEYQLLLEFIKEVIKRVQGAWLARSLARAAMAVYRAAGSRIHRGRQGSVGESGKR